MAGKAPNYVKKDVFRQEATRSLQSLKRGNRIIEGNLSVAPGHDYWWFLEYGTGEFLMPDDGELTAPPEIAEHDAAGGSYQIEVSGAKYLVYMTKYGVRKRGLTAIHPGIHPVGFVRTAIFNAELYLEKETKFLTRKNRLFLREELVETVNSILVVLLGELRLTTPDDRDIDPFHEDRPHSPTLSDAWRINKAK